MDRRSFLRTLALVVGVAAAPAVARKPLRVVVIGAGLAGLGAARVLQQAGHHILVLEARSRIGGRTWTDTSLGVPVDLGAGWIEGTVRHPMSDMARSLGLKTVRTRENFTLFAEGKQLTPAEVDRVDELWETVYNKLQALKESGQGGSVADGIALAMRGMRLSKREVRNLHWAARSAIEGDDAGDLSRLSLEAWDEDGGKKGPTVMLSGGFVQIVGHLARGLDIRTATPVRRIGWDDRSVRVQTDRETIVADRAILTLPLGVLKKGSVVFDPVLPAVRTKVIGRLDMGVLDRVVLRFPRRFWTGRTDWMASVDDPHFVDVFSMQSVTGAPILACLSGASRAVALEKRGDAEVVSIAMDSLRKMYGTSIPSPTAHVVTRWAADPYACGSYSMVPVGARTSDHEALGRPLGALHFAGEATHATYPATTHGAWLSGLRAAHEITG